MVNSNHDHLTLNLFFSDLLERHGEAPSREQVDLFIRMCDRYFSQNPGELIGL